MDQLGTYESRRGAVDLRFERHYASGAPAVWAALTRPAQIAEWLGPARIEPYVGGRFELFVDGPRPMRGRILTWDAPQRLEFTWNDRSAPETVVRCELSRAEAGTRLLFRHKGVGFARIGEALPQWHVHFERLAGLLAGKPQAFAAPRWHTLQRIYLDWYRLGSARLEPPAGPLS